MKIYPLLKSDPRKGILHYDENSSNSGNDQHILNENYIVMKIYHFDEYHFFDEKL